MPLSRISVLILTANRVLKLAHCLQALQEGVRQPDEVVLVINEDGDETARFLDEVKIPFPVVPLRGPGRGYAEARNAGIQAAGGDNVAILDDDCYADRFWLQRMEAFLEEYEAVGGLVLPAGQLRVPPDFSPQLNWLVGLSTPGYFDDLTGRTDLPSTSNVAFRKEVWENHPFQEVGGELTGDRSDYHIGREDAEWWRRLRGAGVRTRVVAEAIVWHDIPESRYALEATDSRAEADGVAHWRREKRGEDIVPAARDILSVGPAFAADVFSSELTPAESRRLHQTWAKRQSAFLREAVSDHDGGVSPQKRASVFAREGGRLVLNLAKPLIRTGASVVQHGMRRTQSLPHDPSNLDRITIVSYSFMGDSILLIPMMEAIRAAAPKCRITLIGAEYLRSFFDEVPEVDRFIGLPGRLPSGDPRATGHIHRSVRDSSPDAIVLAYWHAASPLGIFTATNAPVICWDHDNGMDRELWKELASVQVPKDLRQPEIVSLLNLLAPLGIPAEPKRPRWIPPRETVEAVRRVLQKRGINSDKFACVLLDHDRDSPKAWPTANYAELSWHLFERHGLQTVFEGTRRGRSLYEELEHLPESARSLHGCFDPAELGALLSLASIAVGIDSGPVHLAQAVNTPAIGLFGHVNELQWGPLPRVSFDGDASLPFRALRAPNAPPDWTEAEKGHHKPNERVARIAVSQVTGAIDELLESSNCAAVSP